MLRARSLEAGYGDLKVLKGRLAPRVGRARSWRSSAPTGRASPPSSAAIAGLVRPFAGIGRAQGRGDRGPAARADPGQGLLARARGAQALRSHDGAREPRAGRLRDPAPPGHAGACEADLASVYALFPVLEGREGQLAGTLSGGEQQMLAIGRSLMSRPDLIILDEPSMGLAPLVIKSIFSAIVSLSLRGKTILVVEQNAKAILKIASRGYVMETGSLVLEGTGEELLANRDVQRAYLGKEYSSIDEDREGR